MSSVYLNSVLEIPLKTQPRLRSLQRGLSECYALQLFTDVEVHVRSATFRAHRCVLALHSPMFQRAFYGTRIPSAVCIVNEVEPKGFDLLLRFIYSSALPAQVDWKDVVQAVAAAELLQMDGTKEKLMNHIFHGLGFYKGALAVQRFWSMLEISFSMGLVDLQNKLLKFAERNAETVLNHDDFLKTDVSTAKWVLGAALDTTPEKLLEKVARWKDCNRNLDDLDQSVRELLSCVHFERMWPQDFYRVARRHGPLIPEREALDILMHLVDPTAAAMPRWNAETRENAETKENNDLAAVAPPEAEPSLDSGKWKFKSMEDLQKKSTASLERNRRRLYASRSQVDLNNLDDSKSIGDWDSVDVSARWRGKTLSETFYELMREGLLTDVVLESASGGEAVPAHRLPLALGSAMFADLLYGPKAVDRILRLEETAEDIEVLLRYFYGRGECISPTSVQSDIDAVLRKLDLALKYDCQSLKRGCWQALGSVPLEPRLFWKLMGRAEALETYKADTRLLMRYALLSPDGVFRDEGFFSASREAVTSLLQSDCMNMVEEDLLEHVACWLERNSSIFPDNPSRVEIFKFIRFQALTAEQFYAFLKLHDDLMSKEEAFAILTHLFRGPNQADLPEWCHKGPPRSFCYDPRCKIGTGRPVPWKSLPAKGRSSFACSYTVAVRNPAIESRVQCLELAWQVRPNRRGEHIRHACNLTVRGGDDGGEPLIVRGLPVSQPQRIVVPVDFVLNSDRPKLQLDIVVETQACFAYFFVRKRKLRFENVTMETGSEAQCLCDAVVDGRTSEGVLLPAHLRPARPTPTEECLRPKAEDV